MVNSAMGSRVGAVRGDLLLWAREQQGLTMRQVQVRGGPSLGYQSEVEHGKKSEVRSEILGAWVRALQVTEPFARGQVHRYHENPAACRGLAADVAHLVERGDLPWGDMAPQKRAQQLLRLVASHSRNLPRVVLSYLMGLELATLDEIMLGGIPLTQPQVGALAALTTLPLRFFQTGERFAPEESEAEGYRPVIRLARAAGLSPAALMHLLAAWVPASRAGQEAAAGQDPGAER